MVHLFDAALDVARMVGAVRLPVLTVRAPYWQAVASAGVEVAGVEGLEAKLGFEGDDARVECNSV